MVETSQEKVKEQDTILPEPEEAEVMMSDTACFCKLSQDEQGFEIVSQGRTPQESALLFDHIVGRLKFDFNKKITKIKPQDYVG